MHRGFCVLYALESSALFENRQLTPFLGKTKKREVNTSQLCGSLPLVFILPRPKLQVTLLLCKASAYRLALPRRAIRRALGLIRTCILEKSSDS
jgi:hypothetical protein